MKSNRLVYDQLRDVYNLICEEEIRKITPPAKPIKRKNFGKGRPTQPGRDVYADTNPNSSKIRTHYKDWDESYTSLSKEQPKGKTLKEFRVDAGSPATSTKQDKKNLEYMQQVFLAAKTIEDFEDFIDFVNYLTL